MSPAPSFTRGRSAQPASATPPASAAGARRLDPAALRQRAGASLVTARDRALPEWERAQEASGPVLEWLRATVSPLGWAVLGGAVVCALIALWLGWIEFLTLALMLAIVIVVAVLLTIGRWRHEASLDFADRRIKIGDQALAQVVVSNPGTTPAAGVRVEVPVGRNAAAFRVPRLGGGESHEEVFTIHGRRRGVIVVGPVRAIKGDPLGLLHRVHTWTKPVELFVHPDVVLLESKAMGFLKDVEGVPTQNLSSSDVSFHALRDYVPGDDRRSIHWRTTARTGKLVVRQFEETMRSHLVILLSLDPDDYAEPEAFELAVSTAGSLGIAATREDRRVDVLTSAGLLRFGTGAGLLDELCRLRLRRGSRGLAVLAKEAARTLPGASIAALVAGDQVSAARLREAQVALPAQVATFGVRVGASLSPARRRAGTMTVLDVPELGQLARGLRTLR